jgi:putative Ca2+/H+ antiporter (TMEM165/GDT1 family)
MHIVKFAPLVLLAVTGSSVDVRKGTDIIPPDSAEAAALHHSDKAVKTAPKDNTYADGLDSDNFKKPEPKLNTQKLDIPDTEKLGKVDGDVKVAAANDHPVVLNDYDPNNLGVSRDKSEKADSDKTLPGTERDHSNDETTSPSIPEKKLSQADPKPDESAPAVGTTPLHAFSMAGSMILFSEVGDKTFLIAALMAMKHPRVTVFTSAFASLIVMTILSAMMGHALPTLLPRKLTSLLAAVLFIVFGAKLLREGLEMDASMGVEEELDEVESEIEAKELTLRNDDLESGFGRDSEKEGIDGSELRRSTSSPKVSGDGLENGSSEIPLYKLRSRRGQPASTSATLKAAWKQVFEGVGNLANLVLSPVWVQVFVMTFLGEWGDRSQIATIAMAAGSDYWFVILGAIAGHCVCTLAAVVGGKLLAAKISMRQVTLAGAVSFLVFAVIYFAEGISLSWTD